MTVRTYSVTDVGVGNPQFNFTNAYTAANYVASGSHDRSASFNNHFWAELTLAASFKARFSTSAAYVDPDAIASFMTIGDLA
jgi:hypothetical protein